MLSSEHSYAQLIVLQHLSDYVNLWYKFFISEVVVSISALKHCRKILFKFDIHTSLIHANTILNIATLESFQKMKRAGVFVSDLKHAEQLK